MKPLTKQIRRMFEVLLTPEQFKQLREPGDAACDAERPKSAPDEVSCPMRKGHTGACRYFGLIDEGSS